jgi:hypothetical protein
MTMFNHHHLNKAIELISQEKNIDEALNILKTQSGWMQSVDTNEEEIFLKLIKHSIEYRNRLKAAEDILVFQSSSYDPIKAIDLITEAKDIDMPIIIKCIEDLKMIFKDEENTID